MDLENPPLAQGRDQLELALERELEAGERVRWKGRGMLQEALTRFALYLFAIPWTAFALFWTAMAWSATGAMDENAGFLSYAFPLFGLPFIAVGIFMLATPFLAGYVDVLADARPFPVVLGGQEFTEALQMQLEAIQFGQASAADAQSSAQADAVEILERAAR